MYAMESNASNLFAHFIQYLESVSALYDAYAKRVTQPYQKRFWQELYSYKKAQINVLKHLGATPGMNTTPKALFKRKRQPQQIVPTNTGALLDESIDALTDKMETLNARTVTHLGALLSAQHIETQAVQKELFTICEHCPERVKQTFENLQQDTRGHLSRIEHCVRYEQQELTDQHTTVVLDHPPQA
jgi:hypothetical protein